MAQVPHIEATNVPADIAANLAAGCYVGQVAASLAEVGNQALLFATADQPPASDADYFRATYGEFFSFVAGGDALPTWIKTSMAGLSVPVALAMLP